MLQAEARDAEQAAAQSEIAGLRAQLEAAAAQLASAKASDAEQATASSKISELQSQLVVEGAARAGLQTELDSLAGRLQAQQTAADTEISQLRLQLADALEQVNKQTHTFNFFPSDYSTFRSFLQT